ncbi:unnamed protein product [Boreogadus saida]
MFSLLLTFPGTTFQPHLAVGNTHHGTQCCNRTKVQQSSERGAQTQRCAHFTPLVEPPSTDPEVCPLHTPGGASVRLTFSREKTTRVRTALELSRVQGKSLGRAGLFRGLGSRRVFVSPSDLVEVWILHTPYNTKHLTSPWERPTGERFREMFGRPQRPQRLARCRLSKRVLLLPPQLLVCGTTHILWRGGGQLHACPQLFPH